MGRVLVDESVLSGIADAIRTKTGESVSYYPGQFAGKINGIITSNPIYNSITISSDHQIITPPIGVDAFNEVVVNIPSPSYPSLEAIFNENGSFVAGEDTYFSIATVSVVKENPVFSTLNVNRNGTYIPEKNIDGYSQVVVNIDSVNTEAEAKAAIESIISADKEIIITSPAMKVGENAFAYSSFIKNIDLPNCSIIEKGAFKECENLDTIHLPKCTIVKESAFYGCKKLTNVYIEECVNIEKKAFYHCSALSKIFLQKVSSLREQAFAYCSYLSTATLEKCSFIGEKTFQGCQKLISLYLTTSSICSIHSTALNGTPIINISNQLGKVFVPTSLLEQYKNTENWSKISNKIFAVGDENV